MKGAGRTGSEDRTPPRPKAVNVCTHCSCLCHDVNMLADAAALPDCSLLRDCHEIGYGVPLPESVVEETFAAAARHFATAVRHGRPILMTGLESLDWDTQKAAVSLAEAAGAWVARDFDRDGSSSGWAEAFAQKGARGATWSEIRQRADALLFWYEPLNWSHPRWVERFGPRSPRAHRLAIIAPEDLPPREGWIEDQVIRVDPARACELLRAVRASLRDDRSEPADEAVRRIVHLFRNSRWLAIVQGENRTSLAEPAGTAETLADLVAEANVEDVRRVVCTHLPDAINSAGLDAILSIRAGLASPMRFTPQGPVRAVGEWSPGQAECVMQFGGDRVELWIWHGPEHHSPENRGECELLAKVLIPIGQLGLDRSGTVIRADGVVVPVRGLRGDRTPKLLAFLESLRNDVLRTIEQAAAGPEAVR